MTMQYQLASAFFELKRIYHSHDGHSDWSFGLSDKEMEEFGTRLAGLRHLVDKMPLRVQERALRGGR